MWTLPHTSKDHGLTVTGNQTAEAQLSRVVRTFVIYFCDDFVPSFPEQVSLFSIFSSYNVLFVSRNDFKIVQFLQFQSNIHKKFLWQTFFCSEQTFSWQHYGKENLLYKLVEQTEFVHSIVYQAFLVICYADPCG